MDTKRKKSIIDKVASHYDRVISSAQYQNWVTSAKQAYSFYDGDQWTTEEISKLAERGQAPVVINEISNKIDFILGTENITRTKLAVSPRTFDEQSSLAADAATAAMMQVQETSNAQEHMSTMFKDGVITGIGWTSQYKEDDFTFTVDAPNTFDVVWDIDDHTPQLSDSMFIHEHKWVDVDKLKLKYPKAIKEIESLSSDMEDDVAGTFSTPVKNNDIDEYSAEAGYVDVRTNKIRIIETQYKVPTTAYTFTDAAGGIKQSFDESHAKKNKADGTDITSLPSVKVLKAVWTKDTLLQHSALEVQAGTFELIPFIVDRIKDTKSPTGLVAKAIFPQQEYNKRRSKMMHLMNSRGAVINGGSEEDYAKFKRELAMPDSVFITKRDATFQLLDNMQLAEGQFKVMMQAKREIQEAMGIFDESIGNDTNAVSGTAINSRQAATNRTKAPIFDKFKSFKIRFGRQLLKGISTLDTEILVEISSDLPPVILNRKYMVGDKEVLENDLSTLNFTLAVEEIVDFTAPPEMAAEMLKEMIMNGQGAILQNEALLRAMGIRNAKEIAESVQQNSPSPDQQGGDPQTAVGQPAATPSPIQ